MNDNNIKPFIYTLYNVLFDPDLCDQLFSIITSMNLVHTCIFHKGVVQFYLVLMNIKRRNYHIASRENMHFWLKKKKRQNHKSKPWKEKISGIISSDISTYVGLQGHYWLDVLELFGKKLSSGYILTLSYHHGISQQSTKILDQRHHWIPRHPTNGCLWSSYQLYLPKD